MQKEIKYTGITNIPSDNECSDGDLAVLVNLTNKNGDLHPVPSPAKLFQYSKGDNLIYVHKSGFYTNYIILNGNTLKAFHLVNDEITYYPFTLDTTDKESLINVTALGNTLIFLFSSGIHYALFKDDNYIYLGQKPPFISLSFGLKGYDTRSEEWSMNLTSINQDNLYNELSGENKNIATGEILAKVNKLIQEGAKDKGRFIYPFFVRYAYRLFDGSLYMHSAPVLMIPSSGVSPFAICKSWSGSTFKMQIAALACTLDYQVMNAEILPKLEEWSDIVKGIDIFISDPIYTYNQSGKVERIKVANDTNYPNYTISKVIESGGGITDILKYKKKLTISYFRELCPYPDNGNTIYPGTVFALPAIETDVLKANITDCSLFYKLHALPMTDLAINSRKDIPVGSSILNTLSLQERMTDDYNSHNIIKAQCSFVYNARLNIANISQILTNGFPSESLCPFTGDKPTFKQVFICYTFIREHDKNIIVTNQSKVKLEDFCADYLYYPNINAYKMIIRKGLPDMDGSNIVDSPHFYAEVKLTPHKNLNGACYFGSFKALTWIEDKDFDESQLALTSRETSNPNKLYTSEVNNPFIFPVLGMNTIGTGEIIGISSTTKALSQGQFGQFPLYAFTSEGVWALEVGSTGTYSAKQPATRDICNNPKSITQIDGAIIFTTEQGIMLLQGAESQCISVILDGKEFDHARLSKLSPLLEAIELSHLDFEYIPLKDYLSHSQIAYDYPNKRLMIFNPSQPYAYIFSMLSKTWSTMPANYENVVNSYPDSYITTDSYEVLNLSSKITDFQRTQGLLITRPLKLDTPDILKTVTSLIHRGIFAKGKVKSALYGSRNGIDYYLIASSQDHYIRSVHGTPYKYFRLLVAVDFEEGESLSGTSLVFDIKQTNKLR